MVKMGKYTEAQIELMEDTIGMLSRLNRHTDIFDHYASDLNRVFSRISNAIDSDGEEN